MFNIELYRDVFPEVQTFRHFLSESYDADDILVFLHARYLLQNRVWGTLKALGSCWHATLHAILRRVLAASSGPRTMDGFREYLEAFI